MSFLAMSRTRCSFCFTRSRMANNNRLVDRPEHAPEIIPEGAGGVRVAMGIGFLDRLRGQEAAILAECDEQDSVQELLGAGQDAPGLDGWIGGPEPGEGAAPDEGILRVKLLRQ